MRYFIPSIILVLFINIIQSQAQWKTVSNPSKSTFDLQVLSEQVIFTCGGDGVYKSADGGLTWNLPDQFLGLSDGGQLENLYFSSSVFYDLYFINDQIGFATGWSLTSNAQIIIKTIDGGNSWAISYLYSLSGDEAGEGITSIYFTDTQIGFAAGNNGRIIKTTDQGLHWTVLPTGTTADIKEVYFIDKNNGFAAGENVFMKTTNAGNTWAVIPLQNVMPQSLYFLNSNVGFICTSDKLLKTTDGGGSWSAPLMDMYVNSITFVNSETGYAAGSSGVFKTENGGGTWSLQIKSTSGEFTCLNFLNSTSGMAGTFGGGLYKTTNGGDDLVPPVKITSFTPANALPKANITINGENLDYVSEVIISGISTKFSSSPEVIYTSIPEGATEDKKIELRYRGGMIFSPNELLITKTPYLFSFSPANGLEGTVVTLLGFNIANATSVLFNEIPAQFTITDNSTIKATVPSGNSTGVIKIVTPFGTASSVTNFIKFEVPVILSFSPETNYRQSYILLHGKNFSSSYQVLLNEIVVPAQVVSDTLIKVYGLPGNTTTGKFGVRNLATTGYSKEVFTIIEGTPQPSITGFSPASGKMSQEVIISGKDFLSVTKLRLNDVELNFQVISDTELVTEIPVFAQSGVFTGLDFNGNEIPTITSQFTVIEGEAAPIIDGFSPGKSVIQNLITITGRNLYNISDIYFNGVQASFKYKKDLRSMVVEVPALATSGKITIESSGGQSTSADDFEVISNYCVSSRTYAYANMRALEVIIGNIDSRNEDTNDCKGYYDKTTNTIEAKAGSSIPFYATTLSCRSSPGSSDDYIMHMIYVDWNDDKDFRDDNELIYVSDRTHYALSTFTQIPIPSWAPTSGLRRLRIYSRPWSPDLNTITPCDAIMENGAAGSSADFTLKMVNAFTTEQPSVTMVNPYVVTYGSVITIAGTNLETTSKVLIDNINAPFSYDAVSNSLKVTIPEKSYDGNVLVVTNGGPLLITGKLNIIPTPEIYDFTPQLDSIGAEVTIRISSVKNSLDVTSVFFNGTPSDVHVYGDIIVAHVPPGATSGKIAIGNQFNVYESTQVFTVIRKPSIETFFPLSSRMNENILITGAEFNGITSVDVNGVPGKFKVISSTQILFTIPYGASQGKISVRNKKGVSISIGILTILKSERAFTFNEIPSFNYDTISDQSSTYRINKSMDFDNDGFMDLVVGAIIDKDEVLQNYFTNFITIYKNNGDQTFKETNIRLRGYGYDFGDFDANGYNDIITSNANEFSIYYNSAAGFSAEPLQIKMQLPLDPRWNYTFPEIAKVFDYDHDGDLDFIISGGTLAWYEQVTNGSFIIHYFQFPSEGAGPFLVEDFDKDGDLDVLRNNKMFINTNEVLSESNWLNGDLFNATTLAAADVNSDGFIDVVETVDSRSGDERIHILKNENGNQFTISKFGVDVGSTLVMGDLYNDGTVGLPATIWYRSESDFFKILSDYRFYSISSGIPTLKEAFPYTNPNPPPYDELFLGYSHPSLIDLENDGDLDICEISGANVARVRFFENATRMNNSGLINAAPQSPEILYFVRKSDGSVALKWSNSTDDHTPAASLNYNILIRNNATTELVMAPHPLGTQYGNAGMNNEWIIKHLKPNTIYSFQVQTIDMGYRASAFSAPVNFSIDSVLSAPPRLTASTTGIHINLDWEINSINETGFVIEYKKKGSSNFQLLDVAGKDIRHYVFNATCNSEYSFRVQARDNQGATIFSNVVTGKITEASEFRIAGSLTICGNNSTVLSVLQVFSDYKWSTGNTNNQITVTSAGQYFVTVKDDSGCLSMDTVTVIAKPLPVATIMKVNNQLVATDADTYEWYLDGVVISENSKAITPVNSGLYKVKATKDGCSAFSNEFSLLITAVDEITSHIIYISPNPTAGILTITTPGIDCDVTIINSIGTEIHKSGMVRSQKSKSIDLTGHANGLYLLSLTNGDTKYWYRFVLSK